MHNYLYSIVGIVGILSILSLFWYTTTKNKELPVQTHTTPTTDFSLTSPAFTSNSAIPRTYSCDGSNTPPPLEIHNTPEGTYSFVLVMDDPDIPDTVKKAYTIDSFDHWVQYNIPGDTTTIIIQSGNTGLNTSGETTYTGPCPPTNLKPTTHRYSFRIYALPNTLSFIKPPTLHEVETAAQDSALGVATLTGTYSRK